MPKKSKNMSDKSINTSNKSVNVSIKSANKSTKSASTSTKSPNTSDKSLNRSAKSANKSSKSLNASDKSVNVSTSENKSTKSPNASNKSVNMSDKSVNASTKSANKSTKSPNASNKSVNMSDKSVNASTNSANKSTKSPNASNKSVNMSNKSVNASTKSAKKNTKSATTFTKSPNASKKSANRSKKSVTRSKKSVAMSNDSVNVSEDNDKTVDHERFQNYPNRSYHEKFLKACIDDILNLAVFEGTERTSKVVEFKDPEEMENLLDIKLKYESDSDEKLLELIREIIKYSVKCGHPYFLNQLYSGVDAYGLIGQWLTDALNPSIYTYEACPVFTIMEKFVLEEMRQIIGFKDGNGTFCPGGSIANGFGISCARFSHFPDSKTTGLSNGPRLVLFTSKDSHYSVTKMASFMGIGSDNVYKIQTDDQGKLLIEHLESEICRALSEDAKPFMVSATSGTTVLGAYDPLEKIADLCKKYNLWMHVDAAWGGGALMSPMHRHLLKGIERADSVTWNMHKLLAAPQQCAAFLTKTRDILQASHSANEAYLFQQDKFYDTKFDVGDKHIQYGRSADVVKFWFMWRAKGTKGLQQHIERLFENAQYFTAELKKRENFELILDNPECTNICFWYIPPSMKNQMRNDVFWQKINNIAPKIKERQMKEGTMMISYQQYGNLPNFFRIVMQNSALNEADMTYVLDEIERLGCDM